MKKNSSSSFLLFSVSPLSVADVVSLSLSFPPFSFAKSQFLQNRKSN